MDEKYRKACRVCTDIYSIYYGKGVYRTQEQHETSHYDSDITITYLKSSQGKIRIEGNNYNLESGSIIIMNSKEIHCSEICDESFHERISICINVSSLQHAFKDTEQLLKCFFERDKGCRNVISGIAVKEQAIDRLAEDIISFSKTPDNTNQLLCLCRIIELLVRLNDAFLYSQPMESEKVYENSVVSNVICFIDKEFSKIENCSQIAQLFFVNKFYLEHIFREQVGISLWNYVLLKRLLYAKDLLKAGYSSKYAAHEAGFSNYSNFFRLYKKYINESPTMSKKKN